MVHLDLGQSLLLQKWILLASLIRMTNSTFAFKKEGENNFEDLLRRTINEAFYGFWCLHLSTMGNVSEQIIEMVHKISPIPVNSIPDTKCKGHLLITDYENELPKQLEYVQRTTENRIVVIVPIGVRLALKNTNAYGEAEVVLCDQNKTFRLVMARISKIFLELNPGDDLFPAKSNLPDLMGRTLDVGTFLCPPFSYWTAGDLKKEEVDNIAAVSLDGIEMLAFLELAKRLNFTWKMHEPSEVNKWGKLENGVWSGGVLGRLANKTIDVAFCALWVVEEQTHTSDFTGPWNQLCNTFLVPRPFRKLSWHSVFLSFEGPVWFLLGLAILVTSVSMSISVRLQRVLQRSNKIHKYEHLGTSILEVFGMLVDAYSPCKEEDMGPARHIVSWWFVFSLMVITAFSCGLVSHLTAPTTSASLDTVRDLVEAGFHWGHSYFPSVDSIFDINNTWHQRFIERFQEQDDPEHNALLTTGKHAVFGYKLEGSEQYFTETEKMEPEDWGPMCMLKECLSRYHIALGLTKNSPYTRAFNQALVRLQKAGIMEYWQRNVILRRGDPKVLAVFHDDAKSAKYEPQKLTLSNLQGAFVVFFIGHTVSITVLVFEIIIRKLTIKRLLKS